MEISQNQLAQCMRVPANRIHAIIHGKRAITAETALWLGLQMEYDLRKAGQKYAEAIKLEVLPLYGD